MSSEGPLIAAIAASSIRKLSQEFQPVDLSRLAWALEARLFTACPLRNAISAQARNILEGALEQSRLCWPIAFVTHMRSRALADVEAALGGVSACIVDSSQATWPLCGASLPGQPHSRS